MNPNTLERELQTVAARFRRRALWRNLSLVWLLALFALGMTYFAAPLRSSTSLMTVGLVVLAVAGLVTATTLLRRTELRWVAQQVEQTHPELETKLLAAFEQEQRAPQGSRGFLEEEVIQQARVHALTHDRWRQTLPTAQLRTWSLLQWTGLAAVAALFFTQIVWLTKSGPTAASEADSVAQGVPVEKFAVEVEPGDVELERGSDLLVLARFADPKRLPREAILSAVDAAGERRHSLAQSLSDPIFAGRVPEVRQDLTYRLSFGMQQTRDYRVTVFDYPELQRADAEINYPSYTALPQRRIEDVRQMSLLEGSELKLLCRLNKSVATARLVPAEGEPVELAAMSDDKTLYTAARTLTESVRWRLELTDDRGRKNRESMEFVVEVVPNRPPDLKLLFPRNDVGVSPLQELPLEVQAADDFGILRWGLAYELTGKAAHSFTLGEKLPAKEKTVGKHLLALEDLKAVPDELLAWHVWAEDMGPDGKVRRTTSDIFFAEVNPFDEIFREGQSESGTPGQQQTPADESAKLQKEIISATWNLRRRELGEKPSAKYADDARVIAEAQQKAIESLEKMKEKLRSPDVLTTVAEIETQMRVALRELTAAADGNVLPPLDKALPAEQAAYQGLLKLRARESRVMRSSKSQGGGGGQNANQQKLDQLELSEEQSRYETRKSAEQQATPAQQEREEFLNRLRELARRQEDMNQKIKELQAALEAAKDEAAKQQIERQLKRLRDEQRDLLRDVDQLQNKLDKPEHGEPLADASKQLQQTRENVRQASDALEKGETSQALNAGTRAESELDKLREDFRKQTASRFSDEVRDLLDRAQKLDERQQQIGNELAGNKPENKDGLPGQEPPKPQPKPGLRSGNTPTTKLAEQLGEQHQELGRVLDQAREITERAEGNEPLLSKQLYDAVREAHQKQTSQAVDMVRQLVEHGLPAEAAKVEPQARAGVRQLRDKIEKAAEGVLGDDVESLRRAKSEVDRLAQALAEEIARENPSAAPKAASAAGGDPAKPSAKDANGKPQPGQQGEAGKQSGESGEGKEPGKGQQPGEGKQPGQGQQPGRGDQKGQGESRQASASPGGRSPGLRGQGSQGIQGSQPAEPGAESGRADADKPRDLAGRPQPASRESATGNRMGTGPQGALNGPVWREWSDALRNVEEFVPGTRLRTEAARVREQAQALRAEAKRHSKAPNWDLVRETVYEPLVELQQQLEEELARRSSSEAAVPLDRDPVPDRFGEAVRRYYQRLGSGQ